MSKPVPENPYLPKSKQPLMECWTCGHFVPKRISRWEKDRFNGGCRHTGTSHVPARHACEAWIKQTRKHRDDE